MGAVFPGTDQRAAFSASSCASGRRVSEADLVRTRDAGGRRDPAGAVAGRRGAKGGGDQGNGGERLHDLTEPLEETGHHNAALHQAPLAIEIDVDRPVEAAADVLVLRAHGALHLVSTATTAIGMGGGCRQPAAKTLGKACFLAEIALIIPRGPSGDS